jgi:hypothetical protein
MILNAKWAVPWYEKARRGKWFANSQEKDIVNAFYNACMFCRKLQGKLTLQAVSKKEYKDYFIKYKRDVDLLCCDKSSKVVNQLSRVLENMMKLFCGEWRNVGVRSKELTSLVNHFLCTQKKKQLLIHQIIGNEKGPL